MDVFQTEMLASVKPLDQHDQGADEKLYGVIYDAIQNTHSEAHSTFSTRIKQVYQVDKTSERLSYRPFEKKVHNKFLLWHGCRQT